MYRSEVTPPERHFSKSLMRKARRSPASSIRPIAIALATSLYLCVRMKGPPPTSIGETYTSFFAIVKLSSIHFESSVNDARSGGAGGRLAAALVAAAGD